MATAPPPRSLRQPALSRASAPSSAWCVRRRRSVVLLTIAALAASIASFALIPKQFFPTSNRPELLVDLWLPEGASLRRRRSADAKRLEHAAPERCRYCLRHHLHRRGCAPLLLAARPAAEEPEFRPAHADDKVDRGTGACAAARARDAGARLPEGPLQGRSAASMVLPSDGRCRCA